MGFRGFKKVAGDERSTTFAHPNGARLSVPHGALDKKTIMQLKKMPVHKSDGGGSSDAPMDDKMQDYKRGTDERIGQLKNAAGNVRDLMFGSPEENAYFNPQMSSPAPAAQQTAPQLGDQGPQAMSTSPEATPPAAPAPDMAAADPDQQWMSNVSGGVNQEMGGAQDMANAQVAESKQRGDLAKAQEQALIAQQQAHQQSTAEMNDEYQNFRDDLKNGHINPTHYQENMSSGQKVGTAIGLMFGGIGQGLIGGSNPAEDFLNKQIDRDMQAQYENLGRKKSLLEANMQHYRDFNTASAVTRAQMNDIYASRVEQAAQTAAGPEALAKAKMFVGEKRAQNAMLLGNAAAMQAQRKLQASGVQMPAQSVDNQVQRQIQMFRMMGQNERANDLAQRFVPGVGVASIPVPQEARSQIVSMKNVNDLMNRSLEFSRLHRGTMKPAELAEATAIQNQLLGSVKQAQHDGVYKPSEADFILGQIGGSPASFFANFSSVPKIKELQRIKQGEYNNLLSVHGIHGQALPQQQQQQTEMRGGVPYHKVPGGWKRAQ